MTKKYTQIPTNLITGFLGSGKTTAILQVLKNKPANSNWAVLVNEFGEVGIDGALLEEQNPATGSFIKEVPGGCICCAAGLPFQMALNLLIKQANPQRLLIELSGVGHPEKVMQMLTGPYYKDVLDVRASICLVDPEKLTDRQVNSNQSFVDQMNIADVLLANKADKASLEDIHYFTQFANSLYLPKTHIEVIEFGRFSLHLLDIERDVERVVSFPQAHPEIKHQRKAHNHNSSADLITQTSNVQCDWKRFENNSSDYFGCGWIFNHRVLFNESSLEQWFKSQKLSRIKGFFHTTNDWRVFNRVDGLISNQPTDYNVDSRVEIIEPLDQDWNLIETSLLECIESF